jgi:hypothetical protein
MQALKYRVNGNFPVVQRAGLISTQETMSAGAHVVIKGMFAAEETKNQQWPQDRHEGR